MLPTYLIAQEVFPHQMECDVCHNVMELNQVRCKFRCTNRRCDKEVTMYKNTFFAKARLSPNQILKLA
jgi:hypothetical protein